MAENRAVIFLALAIIGMILLFIVGNYSWENKNIKEIEEGDKVKICGEVESFREIKGVSIMNLKDKTGRIVAVSYDKITGLQTNKSYCFFGEILLYEEKLELSVEKIIEG